MNDISKSVLLIDVLIVISVVVLFASVASVAYTVIESVPTIRIGGPSQNITDNTLEIALPVDIRNLGILSISDIFANLTVKDTDGYTLLEGKSNMLTLPPGGAGTLLLKVSTDLSKLTTERMMRIMTKDLSLPMIIFFQGDISPLIEAHISAEGDLKWGAPVKGLKLGKYSVTPYNSSHSRIIIPITFEDASVIPIFGIIGGVLFDERGNNVGVVEELLLEVRPGQTYEGMMTGYLLSAAASKQSLNMLLAINTSYGFLEWSVIINA